MFSPVTRQRLLMSQLEDGLDDMIKPPRVRMDPWITSSKDFDSMDLNEKTDSEKSRCVHAFRQFLDVSQFLPDEISIRVDGDFVVVHGKHDLKADMHGYASREFTRRCKIPEGIDTKSITSTFTKNGLLIIRAKDSPVEEKVSTIPVEVQMPVRRVVEGDATSDRYGALYE